MYLNSKNFTVNLKFAWKCYRTALHFAAMLDKYEIVCLLLDHKGINVNIKDAIAYFFE